MEDCGVQGNRQHRGTQGLHWERHGSRSRGQQEPSRVRAAGELVWNMERGIAECESGEREWVDVQRYPLQQLQNTLLEYVSRFILAALGLSVALPFVAEWV